MAERAKVEARQGPLAVFLVLLGLVFASATGAAVADAAEGSGSRLSQSRPATASVVARSGQRELAAEDEDDRFDSLVLPPAPRIVTALAPRPVALPAPSQANRRLQRPARAYRARAPPAA